ncbi:MAG TPA: lysophospholipid acyltransferase family protein [Thermoanaerobaculia bacterium]|jgi:1-acyl-sn-glycerol-3-phosphate acyltransferase
MRALRAAAVWTAIGALTVVFGLPAILAAFVPPRGDWFLRFARGWARSVLAVSGVRVEVRHAERLAGRGSVVVAANHESFCDIVVLLANLPFPVRFMAKRGVFRVPVLGWSIAAAGFIPVDRGDRARGAATLEAAGRILHGGRSVLIFPEETRTRTGELLEFKSGAALLALRSGRPLRPLGIAGTRAVLPPGRLLMTPGRVCLAVGEPIETGEPAAGAAARRELTARLREAVDRLRREAADALSA